MKMPAGVYQKGTVVDIFYPYADKDDEKMRPAVILETEEGQVRLVLLKISSSKKYDGEYDKYPYAVKIADIQTAGLVKESWALTEQELHVAPDVMLNARGHLAQSDLEVVEMIHELAIDDDKVEVQSYKG